MPHDLRFYGAARDAMVATPMISWPRVSRLWGRQVLLVGAWFQPSPREDADEATLLGYGRRRAVTARMLLGPPSALVLHEPARPGRTPSRIVRLGVTRPVPEGPGGGSVAHLTARSGYQHLVERLNRAPQGAPPSDLLLRILRILLDEREAELVSRLPIRPFTLETAARAFGTSRAEARRTLEALAARALLLDLPDGPRTRWVLPPPMAGFFEFSMMRVRSDIDQKALAELFHEYLNVEEEFVRQLFGRGETKLGRVFVDEDALGETLEVLDWERASAVVAEATAIGVGTCYCRHKMAHVGKACTAPLEICLTFGNTAASLCRHGFARAIGKTEALDVLQEARERGLVQFGDNVRRRVAFLCNCCGCCCEALLAHRRLGTLRAVHTTGFFPAVDRSRCNGCGACVTTCPAEAMGLVSANDPKAPKRRVARLEERPCLGCGVCVRACPSAALALERRGPRVIPPLDVVHRTVLMAVERGTLHDLVFDDRTLASHRALAAVLGAILKLPPVTRLLATQQLRSRYLEALVERWEARHVPPAAGRRAPAGRTA